MKVYRVLPYVACALLGSTAALAQNSQPVSIQVGPADQSAKYSLSNYGLRVRGLAGAPSQALSIKALGGNSMPFASPHDAPGVPGVPDPGYYPADLDDPTHGAVLTKALSHAVYLNMPPAHWGAPGTYLDDLGESTFIHLVDQYVGSNDDNRYTPGVALQITGFTITNHTLTTANLIAILHAVAALAGHGYGHVYHIFTPKGVDFCLDATDCYSPDNQNLFTFCAFHGSITFSDAVGHVVFTFEPYQDVLGCSTAPGSVNGSLIDSTDDTLSHELFETITDPDGDAWWVHNNVSLFGDEIGDLCSRFGIIGSNAYFVNPVVKIGDHSYNIAGEYSNGFHACAYRPVNGH